MGRGGLIPVMDSDAHRDSRRIPERAPGRETVARWTSPETATLLSEDFPRALAEGQPVDVGLLNQAWPSPTRSFAGWW